MKSKSNSIIADSPFESPDATPAQLSSRATFAAARTSCGLRHSSSRITDQPVRTDHVHRAIHHAAIGVVQSGDLLVGIHQ